MKPESGPEISGPESDLFRISKLAKTEPQKAQEALLVFVRSNFPDLEAKAIRINQSKVSLNSVNGFLVTPDKEFFFKFHSEEGEEKSLEGNEYYKSAVLEEAGLPVITPLYYKTEPGHQFMIYEKIAAPTAFDEFEKLDEEYLRAGKYDEEKKRVLLAAEKNMLKKQCQVFLNSLEYCPAREVAEASIHQLFYNRLAGRGGAAPRADIFYTGKDVMLPEGAVNFNELSQLKWVINGIEYKESIKELIEASKKLLNPYKDDMIPVVTGHGDDHNGNKFFINGEFLFFDPAFAGRQPALLSFIKATAHNTFLHPFWLYSPEVAEENLDISYKIENDKIFVDHNRGGMSPVREELLKLQTEEVWQPLIRELKNRNQLPGEWKDYIQKALFCCPFLVYNLTDPDKYTPRTSLLALSKTVELGSECEEKTAANNFISQLI